MYVIKVHPHRAILEPEYFIKKYEDADEKRDLEIQRVESGIEEQVYETTSAVQRPSMPNAQDSVIEGESTEWEKI